MTSAVFHEQYKSNWRERLFYQYKLYVDDIARLHHVEHVSYTLFIIVNALILIGTLLALGLQLIVKMPWLDLPFIGLGALVSVGFVLFGLYTHRRNDAILHVVHELEQDIPDSLLSYRIPEISALVRYFEDSIPWIFLAVYLYLLLTFHHFIP